MVVLAAQEVRPRGALADARWAAEVHEVRFLISLKALVVQVVQLGEVNVDLLHL